MNMKSHCCQRSLKRTLPFLCLLIAWMVRLGASQTSDHPAASAETGLARNEYLGFKIISDRNIFNSNRRTTGPALDEEKPRRVDLLSLVGTLASEKGAYAFFDGSVSEFRKVLEPGQKIAGCEVASVTAGSVALTVGTNSVELQVGMQMRREDESAWQLVQNSRPTALTTVSRTELSEDPSSDDSDIVKRLMQQREREIK